MKKILLYTIQLLAILLPTSCLQDPNEKSTVTEGKPVAVSFNVDVTKETISPSAVDETTINNLWLLVFDESGNFIARSQASFTGSTFTATLPQSVYRRYVHFIANYDWTGFSDAAAMGKSEGEVIAPLATTNLTFWQRVQLNSGIYANAFSSTTVSLVRNMAKLTLVNNATSTFSNAQFALFNKPSAGTVAPFNTSTWTFDGSISEPLGVTALGDPDPYGTTPLYCFERKNSTAGASRTYAIIKGAYSGTTYYYKIELTNSSNVAYDLTRNTLYAIRINSVTGRGYTDEASAKSGPASNNIWTSIELSSLTSVDNGTYALSVDPTSAVFISNGQTLYATATYYRLSDNTQFNSSITVTLNQDPLAPVVNGSVSYNTSTGLLTAAINNLPADGSTRTATITVSAGGLTRTIYLTLGQPYNFTNVYFSPSSIAAAIGSATTLNFTIPNEAADLLPLTCNIFTGYLAPASAGSMSLGQEGSMYFYRYIANEVGVHSIAFNTSVANAAEAVLIEANQFAIASASYTNTGNVYRFSNATITPTYVPFGTGQKVILTFSVPTAGTFQIYTNNLTPTSGSVVSGIYTYTATSAGLQTIQFTTNKAYATETIRLKGPAGYIDYFVPLNNQLIQVSGKLTYRSGGSILASRYITLYVNSQVVGVILTDGSGKYQATIKAKIGDVLTFNYNEYTATATLTSATMTINAKLL